MESRRAAVEQRRCLVRAQPPQLDDRQASVLEWRGVPGSHRGDQRHGHVLQPPGDEREHAQARSIEPVRVVNEQDHRTGVGRVADQPEGGHGDSERIGVDVSRHSERSLKRRALRIRQQLNGANDGKRSCAGRRIQAPPQPPPPQLPAR